MYTEEMLSQNATVAEGTVHSSSPRRCRSQERVEIAAALTSEHLLPGRKILYGKTRRVKFNRHIVITSQSTNRDEILDKRGRNKDIVQM
jgi:hypothetical protein